MGRQGRRKCHQQRNRDRSRPYDHFKVKFPNHKGRVGFRTRHYVGTSFPAIGIVPLGF